MKSSSGDYFQALDHVRALAVFTVFFWHFNHFNNGHLASPISPALSFLTEGHTGVAIFMTLSGYLFAKLLDNRRFNYRLFLWNRIVRLGPLLLFTICLSGLIKFNKNTLNFDYFSSIVGGMIFPSLPNGGWSITVELHFYIFLPALLYIANRSKFLFVALLIITIAMRMVIFQLKGEVQLAAYWSIVGRIDQFVLGIFAFYIKDHLAKRGWLVFLIFFLFLIFWAYFDSQGGFYSSQKYPSPSPIWIFISTAEGFAYSAFIAWYDSSFTYSTNRVAKFLAMIGSYSYSIYLMHFYVVFEMPYLINKYIFDISNYFLLFLAAIACFCMLIPFAYLSYKFIEEPFLKYRKIYINTL